MAQRRLVASCYLLWKSDKLMHMTTGNAARLWLIFVAFTVCSAVFAQSSKATCDRESAILAESEASCLKDWNDVFKSFRRFSACDDAAIGEGYSSSVERLLVDRWQDFDRVATLTKTNKAFQVFVLRHIDALWSPANALTVSRNARQHCPAVDKHLCALIIKKIEIAGKQ